MMLFIIGLRTDHNGLGVLRDQWHILSKIDPSNPPNSISSVPRILQFTYQSLADQFCNMIGLDLQMRVGKAAVDVIKSMEFSTTYDLGPSSRLLCKFSP